MKSRLAYALVAVALVVVCLAFWFLATRQRPSSQTLTVAEGFEVERVAGPPLVDRPILADFDEQGRLYVTDSSGSNDKVEKQLAERPHRIVRLEDTNGDGRFDRSVVFADRMMFPEGAMWFDGSLYVSAPPSIWRLTDTDGDGVADQREEWFQGKTLTGCANDLHGPYLGPDGWIYWCKGAFGEQTHAREGKGPLVTRASHIFRRKPGSAFVEPVMTGGMDNPVDVAFTPGGERILTATYLQHPEAGRRDGLIHAIYGGVYGKVNDVVNSHPQTGDLMPVMTHLGPAVPCGLTRYTSAAFGEGYRDNFFACLFNLHKVTRHELVANGSSFTTQDSDFLVSTDPDFHPTDVLEDADGSLLVIDTGAWYKLCCPTSQLAKPDVLGAIYRIRKKNAPEVDDPRGLKLDWVGMKPSDLARLLDDLRPAVRSRAIERLGKQGGEAAQVLAATLASSSAEARRNAVWALTRIDGVVAREAVRQALSDADETVRQAACHSVAVWRDAGALPVLTGLLKEGAPAVQRAAAEALGRIGNKEAVPELLASAPKDRVLEHSVTYALIEIADPAGTARGLQTASSQTKRMALIALDQMAGGGLEAGNVTPLLASSDPVLKETAAWIAGRHPEWGPKVATFFRSRLAEKSLRPEDRDELQQQLTRFAKNADIQLLLASTAQSAALKESRLCALRAMAKAPLKTMPASWSASLAGIMAGGDAELVQHAVMAARALPVAKEQTARLNEGLLRVGRDARMPQEARLDALAAVTGDIGSIEPELFDFLRASVKPSQTVAVRGSAASALAKAELAPKQLVSLVDTLREAGPLELSKLLVAFENASDEALGVKLIAALKQAKGLISLRSDVLKTSLAKFPASVKNQGDELLASLEGDTTQQKVRLEKLLGSLQDGDVRRGQIVFNSNKAACSACHAIGYLGGKAGPDLTKIGEVRTERDLLEAIVYPSASFVRSYEPLVVVTKSGDVHNGVVRQENDDEILLATGPRTEVRVAQEEIKEMRPGTVSVMPAGLEEQLSRQELTDLLAFLKGTRWGAQ
ncbi:MAG: HEAT repeat domain-containing protein [Acidobacteria bacterium]|nr:HEAT repeat domain-containing protein [Acidobacteriota bacterium]